MSNPMMHYVRFNAGDTIIAEGESGDTAYLIVSGSVEVSVGDGDKQRILATLNAGDVFGEMCLIEPGLRSATGRPASIPPAPRPPTRSSSIRSTTARRRPFNSCVRWFSGSGR